MSELKHAFAENLRVRRINKHWSQRQLAEASGVGVDAISKYECCACSPTLKSIVKLSKALNCTPNDLCVFPEFK